MPKSQIWNVDEPDFLMRLLFDAYYWFDESLQRSMQAQNIPTLSRSQSMVMICLGEGIRRPSTLARKLRVSRQAMQKTLADLEAKGYLRLVPDPEDRRAKYAKDPGGPGGQGLPAPGARPRRPPRQVCAAQPYRQAASEQRPGFAQKAGSGTQGQGR
jgi:hypothetical protein